MNAILHRHTLVNATEPVGSAKLRRVFAILSVTALLASSPALAQVSGEHAVDKAKASRPDRRPSLIQAHAAFGKIDEDAFFTALFKLNYNQDYWGIGVRLPLRIRLSDKNPQDEEALGILRKEDWDEWTDAFRLFRYAYVGRADKLGPVYALAGALERMTLGHGSILHRYHNGMDINRWRVGVNSTARTEAFGGEAIVGDVLAPYLMGVRGWIRPFEFRLFPSYWDRLEVGTTLVADWVAPFEIEREDRSGVSVVKIDDRQLPEVAENRALAIVGIDVGMLVFESEYFDITPYVDFNKMSTVDEGWGAHVGVLWGSTIPAGKNNVEVSLRTEYRRVAGDYLGPYFNTVYEIERYQRLAASGRGGGPKLRTLCSGEPVNCDDNRRPWRNGVFFELQGGLKDVLLVGLEFIDYGGEVDDGSFRLFVEVPYFQYFQLRWFYYRVNLEGAGDLFAFDDRTAMVAEVHVPIYVLGFRVRWWRVWEAVPDGEGYRGIDDWNLGLILRIKL